MKHELDTQLKEYRVVCNGLTLRVSTDFIELTEFVNSLDYTVRATARIELVPTLSEGLQLLVEKKNDSFV